VSTICKLDPEVRQQRRERSNSRRFFRAQSGYRTDTDKMCVTIAEAIDKLIKDPARSGAVKHAIAQRIERDFEAIMAAIQAAEDAKTAEGKFVQASTPVEGI
jgi:hypothetical protein